MWKIIFFKRTCFNVSFPECKILTIDTFGVGNPTALHLILKVSPVLEVMLLNSVTLGTAAMKTTTINHEQKTSDGNEEH